MKTLKTTQTRIEDGVLYATFDGGPLNLFGAAFASDLVSIVQAAESNPNFRVIVFDSASPEFFIAHVDMVNVKDIRTEIARLMPEPSTVGLFRRMSTLPVVTIAEVAGRVRGIGNEFALACDMRFASREKAVFGQPEVGLGLIPGAGGAQHLTRQMGRGRAMEVLLSGEDFPADIAERYGWINRSLPDADLSPFVDRLAKRIASFPATGLETIKSRVNNIALASEVEMEADARLFLEAMPQPETQSRLKALLDNGLQAEGEVERDLGRSIATL